MQGIRQQQINQLASFYRGIQVVGQTAMGQDYRIPISLTRANQPLFVKVHISFQFPQAAPTFHVMHRVYHKNIDPGTFMYTGPSLAKWGPHSNLLNITR